MESSRRGFFSQLGVIIAASMAPTIFIPKIEPVVWKSISPTQIYQLKCRWSRELEQDLMAYHGIDAKAEIRALATENIKMAFPNAQI